jgi:oligopeptidase A
VLGLERLGDRMGFVWGLVGHMMAVRNTPELRAAHETMQPAVIEFSMKLGQSRPIYDKLRSLREGNEWATLSEGQQRSIKSLLHDAETSGVGLDGDAKQRFNQLQQEMADQSTSFANHLMDATKAFTMDLTDKEQVDGLPASLLALAAQSSADENATAEDGPWRITLDFPSAQPFLMHSKRRELRQQLFTANVTRASAGELDNSQIILDLLKNRREAATILGFASWAELSLSNKMAPDVASAEALLEEVRHVAHPAAKLELEELIQAARDAGAPEADSLQPWDRGFWTERVREARFDFEEEQLRPYFPMPRVLDGLFSLIQRLFGVTVEQTTGIQAGWHEDVIYFQLKDGQGAPMASLFLDPFARTEDKRGGAWMNDGLGRTRLFPGEDGSPRLPVAYIVCNFTPPVGGKPAQLSFGEVETLFHEFGHALQHMLTRVEDGMVAGIGNVEWDAVELPSQFMENWCYHEPTLMGMTGHVDTGEPLPKDLFDKVCAARTFHSGNQNLRQLHFGMLDLELHHRFDAAGSETLEDVENRIAANTVIGERFEGDRRLCGFAHIFAGGYSAGYYSYKWAEVLSADAFGAFEEAGLENEQAIQETGRRFAATVLALGGSRAPMDVFKEFRGREPSTEALLRHSGLLVTK